MTESERGSLEKYTYEPDSPNNTPRITGVWELNGKAEISVIRKSLSQHAVCDRFLFTYESVPAGFGYCATTYIDDGNPLPSFEGEPMLLPLKLALF